MRRAALRKVPLPSERFMAGLFDQPVPEAVPSPAGADEGERRRNTGLARADAGADEAFKVSAEDAWKRLLASSEFVTSDDLWKTLTEYDVSQRPYRAQVIGAIVRASAIRRQIEDSGRMVKTARANGHRRKITVWKVVRRG